MQTESYHMYSHMNAIQRLKIHDTLRNKHARTHYGIELMCPIQKSPIHIGLFWIGYRALLDRI